ncbi:hypothetical protein K2X05_04320, partial [bacterium]|nr:hypothetical protein [bacterium]
MDSFFHLPSHEFCLILSEDGAIADSHERGVYFCIELDKPLYSGSDNLKNDTVCEHFKEQMIRKCLSTLHKYIIAGIIPESKKDPLIWDKFISQISSVRRLLDILPIDLTNSRFGFMTPS